MPLETIPSQDANTFLSWLQYEEEDENDDTISVRKESGEMRQSTSRPPLFPTTTMDPLIRLERIDSMRRYNSLLSSANTSNNSLTENPSVNSMLSNRIKSVSDKQEKNEETKMSDSIVNSLQLNHSNVDVSSIFDDHFDDETSEAIVDTRDVDWNIWNTLSEDYEIYGYGQRSLPFQILGTSASDEASHPHCLSPPLMESLSNFLPYKLTDQNFWMKYSLVRDGASLFTLLKNIRASRHTLIALETTDGDVFGSFTSTSWCVVNFLFFHPNHVYALQTDVFHYQLSGKEIVSSSALENHFYGK